MIFGTNSQKKYNPVENVKKNEHRHWILHIRISLSTNFQLKRTSVIFWTKFTKKGNYFQSKRNKIDTTIESWIFELVFASNAALNKQFWIFWTNLPKKDIYGQNRKMKHHHWIPLIQISLGTKFQLELTILIFLTRFTQKGFSGLKQKSEHHKFSTEFCIFKLV